MSNVDSENALEKYELSVLFDGYSFSSNETAPGMRANCTCTLIKGPKNIIIDTMTAWDGNKLTKALQTHNLHPRDINYVICTHGHSDHIGCNYLFNNAIHIVGNSISKQDFYFDHDFSTQPYIIDEHIKVISTPGHTLQDVSVIFKSVHGVYAVTGDLFEEEEDLDDAEIWKLAGSDNEKLQEENRKRVLEIADFIVPGHGKLFKNPLK